MEICSYLLIAEPGAAEPLARRLAALPGCDVARACNRDVLLLVVESDSPEAQEALRGRIAEMTEVQALALTFGEVAAEDPAPVLEPSATS
jgi:nitrate reductase NapAB chaperone NapD